MSIPNQCENISGNNSVEIIDLINPKSNSSFLNDDLVHMHFTNGGGLIQGEPIICGGYNYIMKKTSKNVIPVRQPNKNKSNLLIERGWGAASMVLKLNDIENLWITGGRGKTTEFVSIDQPPVSGPTLPFFAEGHTMEYVDDKIMIIGGYQDGEPSNKTWIIDPTKDFEVVEGPLMNDKRTCHSSATMNMDGRKFIVVVGGFNKDSQWFKEPCDVSVELLDITSSSLKWKEGKDLLDFWKIIIHFI